MCLRTHKRHPRLCPISIPFTISPLTLELLPLPRLTPIRSSTFLLLVSTHTCAQSYVHSWRGLKSEALGHFDKIELVNVEYRAKAVRGVGLEVGAVTILCGLRAKGISTRFSTEKLGRGGTHPVKIVVLPDELLQL